VVGIAGSLHLIVVEVEASLSYTHFCSHTLRKFFDGSVSKRVLTPAVPVISKSQPPLKEHFKSLELDVSLNSLTKFLISPSPVLVALKKLFVLSNWKIKLTLSSLP